MSLLFLAAITDNVACEPVSRSAPGGTSGTSTAVPDYGPDVAVATVCRDPATGKETGRYIFSVMNEMLQRCPEIGAALPFTQVTTCDQAKAFSVATTTYATDHSIVGCEPSPKYKILDPVEESSSAVKGTPVLNSDFPNAPNPAVMLAHTIVHAGVVTEDRFCSGVFVAKNYVLTARHCLVDDEDPTLPLNGFERWTIYWATSDASKKYQYAKSFYALQIPFSENHDPDLALLYLPTYDGQDRFLPASVSRYGAYVARDATVSSDPHLRFAGWGVTHDLETTDIVVVDSVSDTEIKARANAPGTIFGDKICSGDSGGPLYYLRDGRMVVIALDIGRDPTILPWSCGEPDAPHYFVRVDTDDVITWMNGQMERQNGSSRPFRGPGHKSGNTHCWPLQNSDGTEEAHVYQCWGSPCGGSSNLTCQEGSVCVGSGSDYASLACDNIICGGGCSCVVGECVFVDPFESPDAGSPSGP